MGCESIAATMVKGPVHHAIDELVKDPVTRAKFLAELKELQPDVDQTEKYLDILKRHAPTLVVFKVNGTTINLLDYLHDTWYNPRGNPPKTELGKQWKLGELQGFWLDTYHPTEPIIRQGLIRALELANEQHLPLDSYWMANGKQFETLVIHTPHQITRILVTPPTPPPQNPRNLMNFADIRVIKRGEPADYETPENRIGQVIITKLLEWSQR
jgi:hypothetical protein